MTAGAGYCPNCGSPLVAAGQPFCAACGFALRVPPPAPSALSRFGPAQSLPASVVAPGKSGFTMFGASPALLLTAVVVIAVIAVGAALMTARSRSTTGSIEISPSSFSCDLTLLAPFHSTIRLPSSVGIDDSVNIQIDGSNVPEHVGLFFNKQSDGSWQQRDDTRVDLCARTSYALGTHDIRVLDSGGHVLAQGSFTITP